MTETASQLEEIASRAVTLYSRPTVAMELVRLADQPHVDAHTLKECVSQDPALTCKVLRVVNSSLYGLNRPVADLNQAIGLLGIKPLKLLVLGFSLPDALFAELAARELQWYWTNTLTRAVAARLLSEQLWRRAPHETGSGDEAFIAGLLQDIGILVLLRELGRPYATFLTGVIDEKCHLAALEKDSIGFDHVQLSVALLAKWHLPQRLVDAIAAPKQTARLARMTSPNGDLPQVLHLAELLMQLVGQRRFQVLPELLEAGKVYRGLTKSKLTSLVEGLQPQVDQLAEVLSLELSEKRDYVQTLIDSHRHMSVLSEQIAGASSVDKELQAYNQLLAHTDDLSDAVHCFLSGRADHKLANCVRPSTIEHAAHGGEPADEARTVHNLNQNVSGALLLRKLAAAATRCRERRQELSLLFIEPNGADKHADPSAATASAQARRALGSACAALEHDKVTLVPLSEARTAAILRDCERRSALALAHNVLAEFSRIAGAASGGILTTTLSIGVATMSVVPKNFDPLRMVDRAARCLSAARAGGISAVKSIEV